LIGGFSKCVRKKPIVDVSLRPRAVPEAAEPRDFEGKSFPTVPQGQDLHRRR